MGGYEQLLEQPLARTSGIPFICFTDDKTLTSDTWEVRVVPPALPADPTRSARSLKILGQKSLSQFDETLWIDNTVLLRVDPGEVLDEWLSHSDLAMPLHSYRTTVMAEFEAVLIERRDEPARVNEQFIHYRATAPDVLEARPLWTAIIARRHGPLVARAMESWWLHVLRYSRRDQLSVIHALRDTGLAMTEIELDNFRSPLHEWPRSTGRPTAVAASASDSEELIEEVGRLHSALDAQARQFTSIVAARDVMLGEIESSTSWRITAPLRRAVKRLGRGSRRDSFARD